MQEVYKAIERDCYRQIRQTRHVETSFCRGRISVFKAISAYCLLQLLIVVCGNLCFAIAGVFGRANRGGDYDG